MLRTGREDNKGIREQKTNNLKKAANAELREVLGVMNGEIHLPSIDTNRFRTTFQRRQMRMQLQINYAQHINDICIELTPLKA